MSQRSLSRSTLLSIVIPVFNEEEVLPFLFSGLEQAATDLPVNVEIIMVNDGSRDRSLDILLAKARSDTRYRIVDLSRNFGHQLAVSAALSLARGDVVAILDADLQDPPELLGPMLARWQQGIDVVYGQRDSREGETRFKRWSAGLFYCLLSWGADAEIPQDTGDFRVMDRRVVEALNAMPERHRFLRGMVAWLGFRQEPYRYSRRARRAGTTKYPFVKMFALSMDALFSFSMKPLRWMALAGLGMTMLGFVAVIALIVLRLQFPAVFIPGFATTMAALLSLFGFNFLCLGILGEYLGRIFINVQGRPSYVIRDVYAAANLAPDAAPHTGES